MADVAVAIRSYLLTRPTVTDVIGQRLYADRLPQGATIPAVEMTIVSDVPEMQLSDISGVTKARVQLNCIAERRSICRAIAQAIRTSGVAAIKGTYSTVRILGVAVGSTFDSLIETTDGSDDSRYQTTVELMVDYLEA